MNLIFPTSLPVAQPVINYILDSGLLEMPRIPFLRLTFYSHISYRPTFVAFIVYHNVQHLGFRSFLLHFHFTEYILWPSGICLE